jgi:dTDP-4-dehydrorhamnose 3,5-epimerase
MELKESPLKGCFVITPKVIEDARGRFVKPFHIDEFSHHGLYFEIKEEYYSVSKKDVLRGLHFQTPPKATKKIVSCLKGKIFDVVVDLIKSSSSFQQVFSVELSSDKGNMLYIPEGFAHGFCVLSDEATVLYMCSKMYSAENDAGILWNSAGIQWPLANPVVSEKDNRLVELNRFDNPF